MRMDKASELIKTLGESDDYFERQRAAWALVGLGEEAVEPLIAALQHGEFSDLRYKAAWCLGRIRSPKAVDPIGSAMLNDSDFVVREWCAAALEGVGDSKATPYLVQAMKLDSSKDVRLRAAMALRSLKAADSLRELLSCAEPETRGLAVTGLARIKCEDAIDEVASLLEDESAEVRRRAAAFMGEFESDRSVQYLGRSLKDPDPAIRSEALKSLGRIRCDEACRMALCGLSDDDLEVRLSAVTSLGEIGSGMALEPLVEVMFGTDNFEIRAWAAWSLGEIGDPKAIEPLRKAVRTCPKEVMDKARDSLQEVFKVEP
jgi:HEAT repeat protein